MPLLRRVSEIITRTYLSKNPHFFANLTRLIRQIMPR